MRKRITGILILAACCAGVWAQEMPQIQDTLKPQEVREVQEEVIPQEGGAQEALPLGVEGAQSPQEGSAQELGGQEDDAQEALPLGVEGAQSPQEAPGTQELQEAQTPSEMPEVQSPLEGEEGQRSMEEGAVKLNEVLEPQETPDVERTQDQPPRKMVPYGPDFEFREGIYANFEMVKNNDPIPTARIVTDVDMFDRDFYEKVTSQKEIVIYDDNGVKKVMETKDIWGYGRNGVLYINVGNAFHRISFVGSISHFVASVTTYSPNYYDPYYYNPYYSNSYYYNRYNMPRSNYTNTELRQYLLDFETGDVMNYDTESVEVLLMKDPELADEYGSLRNRKKKQMKFVYIRKYNEKHPLYFPSN